MNEEDFKPGDIVHLRSGSPPMTVTGWAISEATKERLVTALWFNYDEDRFAPYYFEAHFPPAALTHDPPKPYGSDLEGAWSHG